MTRERLERLERLEPSNVSNTRTIRTIRTARTTRTIRAAVVIAFVAAVGVSAHHSQSGYDATKSITIVGTLKAISWANPHSLFFVEGQLSDAPDGAIQRWSVEGPNPRQLEQNGWSRVEAKVGDRITMTGRPRRDGKAELLLTSLVTAAGKAVNFRPDGPQ